MGGGSIGRDDCISFFTLRTDLHLQVGAAVFAFSYPSSDLRLVTLPPLGTNIGVIQVIFRYLKLFVLKS